MEKIDGPVLAGPNILFELYQQEKQLDQRLRIMKNTSKTDWQRLKNMKDEDIDTYQSL